MKQFAFFVLALTMLAACKSKTDPSNLPGQPAQTTLTDSAGAPPPDFQQFYAKFHADSLYQVAHINWPLPGMDVVQTDSSHADLVHKEWQPAEWRMHQAVDFSSGDFEQELQLLGDVMVIERIRTAGANYGLERRFAKRPNGEWELIYYAYMHEIVGN